MRDLKHTWGRCNWDVACVDWLYVVLGGLKVDLTVCLDHRDGVLGFCLLDLNLVVLHATAAHKQTTMWGEDLGEQFIDTDGES